MLGMKKLGLFGIVFLLVLGIQCKKEENAGESGQLGCETSVNIIDLGGYATIELPECFENVPVQGIDTYVAQYTSIETGVSISIDLGLLAGQYVPESAVNRQTGMSVNEEFWYQLPEDLPYYSTETNCCFSITFPNLGPANFSITGDVEDYEEWIGYMETFTSL